MNERLAAGAPFDLADPAVIIAVFAVMAAVLAVVYAVATHKQRTPAARQR